MVKCNLSRLLGERRWTQADLARRTGIRPNTICSYYNGFIRSMKLKHLKAICDALDCDLSELIEYTPKSRNNK